MKRRQGRMRRRKRRMSHIESRKRRRRSRGRAWCASFVCLPWRCHGDRPLRVSRGKKDPEEELPRAHAIPWTLLRVGRTLGESEA